MIVIIFIYQIIFFIYKNKTDFFFNITINVKDSNNKLSNNLTGRKKTYLDDLGLTRESDGTLTFIRQQGGFRKNSKAKFKNKYKVNKQKSIRKYKKKNIRNSRKKKKINKQIKKQNKSLSLRRNKSTKKNKKKKRSIKRH